VRLILKKHNQGLLPVLTNIFNGLRYFLFSISIFVILYSSEPCLNIDDFHDIPFRGNFCFGRAEVVFVLNRLELSNTEMLLKRK